MDSIGQLVATSPFLAALLASFIGGFLATTAGALPAMFMSRLSPRANNGMLAFAAGVMLAATIFSLMLPSLSLGEALFGSRRQAAIVTVAAMMVGGLMMSVLHRILPHEHFAKGVEGPAREHISRVWLFVLAITVHNFPEGLSMGVGAASGNAEIGLGVTLAIGLQNIPEGLAVAMALFGLGYRRLTVLGLAALTGAVEILGGMLGAGLLAVSQQLLPAALAFAAGAMLFVISDEVIPETHRTGFGDSATAALFVGFGLMFYLDVAIS